tara:strand:+ start:1189 stop:1632 length:444 start_codon:yes stop_codon:yes gene_type:complete
MDQVKEIQQKLYNINQRFFLILENFVDVYVNTKIDPNNPIYTKDMSHIKDVVRDIEHDIFLTKNRIEKSIENNDSNMNKDNEEIHKLQQKNKQLSEIYGGLLATSRSAVGLFDDETQLYTQTVINVVIYIVTVVYGGYYLRKLVKGE